MCENGKTDKKIAEKLNRSRPAITQYRINKLGIMKEDNKKSWTDEETGKLIKLYFQGVSQNKIAKILSRTHSSIAHKIEKLCLPDIFDS